MTTAYTQISANKTKTWILMFIFTAFVLVVAYIISLGLGYRGPGALSFLGIFLIISALINFFSYYYSDKLVIAMSGAKPVEKKDAPELYRTVENLSIAQGIPMPKVYMIQDPAPNAFATGRDEKHAAVAVTTGLLERLDDLELEGVIAHELSHIKNYDSRLMTIVVVLVGLVAILSDFFIRMQWFGGFGRDREARQGAAIFMILALIAAILAPIAAQLIRFAISRKREFLADASGALLTRHPDGLAQALEKIASYTKPVKNASAATAHLYISNPFGAKKPARQQPEPQAMAGGVGGFLLNLFNTHPPIEERIKTLRAM
jgi:heat shock protein HtpX